jgi:UDP-glucose 4-epimerase
MTAPTQASSPPLRRVVILGANGFVGRALAHRLQVDGIKAVSLGSASIDLSKDGSGDRLAAELQKGDTVVFASAVTPDKGRDLGTLIKNLHMAENVQAAMAVKPLRQLVYFSSDAVYGYQAGQISEATDPSPDDLYGLMHRSREVALAAGAVQAGLPFFILRPSAIYGPGDTHNSYGPNRFIRSALKENKVRIFGQGEETRDHVFIGDVVSLTSRVIHQGGSGTLNIVSGRTVSFADLAKQIAALKGSAVAIESQARSGPVTHRSFKVSAIRERFPSFIPVDLEIGLRNSIAAFTDG